MSERIWIQFKLKYLTHQCLFNQYKQTHYIQKIVFVDKWLKTKSNKKKIFVLNSENCTLQDGTIIFWISQTGRTLKNRCDWLKQKNELAYAFVCWLTAFSCILALKKCQILKNKYKLEWERH